MSVHRSAGRIAVLLAVAAYAIPAHAQQAGAGDPGTPTRPMQPERPPGEVTTLSDAIRLAYERNPRLLAQRATQRATDEQYVQARSQYGPRASASASYTYANDRTEIAPPIAINREGFSSQFDLSLSQPLYTSGRNFSSVRAAEANVEFGRENLRIVEADLLLNVIDSYVGVVRDRAVMQILQENLRLLTRQQSDTAKRLRVGDATATEQQQADSRLELARAQLVEGQNSLEVSEARFLQYIGTLPRELAPLPPVGPLPATIREAYDAAETGNPLLLAAQARERASRAGLANAKAQTGPTVSLGATASEGSLGQYTNDPRQRLLRAGVTFELPLFSSGQISSQIREARQTNFADWRLLDQAARDVRQSVSQAWDTVLLAREAVAHYEIASARAQVAYDNAVRQQAAGFLTTIDVLDLARDLLSVRTTLERARSNAYVAQYQLLAAMGRLEAPNLVPGLERYDPSENFEKVRRKGDVPWTPVLHFLDSAYTGDLTTGRPLRDDSAPVRKEGVDPAAVLPPPAADESEQR